MAMTCPLYVGNHVYITDKDSKWYGRTGVVRYVGCDGPGFSEYRTMVYIHADNTNHWFRDWDIIPVNRRPSKKRKRGTRVVI